MTSKSNKDQTTSRVAHFIQIRVCRDLVNSVHRFFSPVFLSEDWRLNGHWQQLLIFLVELRNKDADALTSGHTVRIGSRITIKMIELRGGWNPPPGLMTLQYKQKQKES